MHGLIFKEEPGEEALREKWISRSSALSSVAFFWLPAGALAELECGGHK